MGKKFYSIILIFTILFLPGISNAAIIGNLENLSNVAYRLGQEIYLKKKDLNAEQAYSSCKTLTKVYDTKLAGSNANEEQFLYYMSPAQVTYCWSGYLNNIASFSKVTSKNSIDALNQGAYILGRTLYKNDSGLSARQSFLKCKSKVEVYNENIAESNGNELGFLRLMSPGELSYCWVGYLDAAGERK
jgi:hypothetical protein